MKIKFTEELYVALSAGIDVIRGGENFSPLHIFSESLALISRSISQLRNHIQSEGFESEEDEIRFFKEIKPRFYALYIYTNEDHYCTMAKPVDTLRVQMDYYRSELSLIQRHFDQHAPLYEYYRTGSDDRDRLYFLRENNSVFDLSTGIADKEFSTQKDYAFAKFMAYETLRDKYIRKIQLIELEIQAPLIRTAPKVVLQWTDPKISLVELAYGIYLKGSINHGNIHLKDIVFWLEQSLSISLDDFNRKFIDISRRKLTAKAEYLERLRAELEEFLADPGRGKINSKGKR